MEWVKLNLEWFGMYIKKILAGYVLIATGMAFVGCGDDSSSEAEYEFEVVGDSASSSLVDRADSLANAVTESSSDFQVPSSSSAVNPGVSKRKLCSLMGISSVCLVVFFPRASFLEISPVSI